MKIWKNIFDSSGRNVIILFSAVAVFLSQLIFIIICLDIIKDKNTEQEVTEKEGVFGMVVSKHLEAQMKPFDPNTVDSTTLADMGIDKRRIRSLLGYRRKQGKIRTAEDLARLYNWTEGDVQRLRKYIVIGEEYKRRKRKEWKEPRNTERTASVHNYQDKTPRTEKFSETIRIDVNTADSATLCKVPGIGKTISSIIIRRRERLGGFHSKEQLFECKYFDEAFLKWLYIDSLAEMRKIEINKATYGELIAHPYISKEQTKALMNYRRLYGRIEDADILRHTDIFKEEELEKLLPYMSFK